MCVAGVMAGHLIAGYAFTATALPVAKDTERKTSHLAGLGCVESDGCDAVSRSSIGRLDLGRMEISIVLPPSAAICSIRLTPPLVRGGGAQQGSFAVVKGCLGSV